MAPLKRAGSSRLPAPRSLARRLDPQLLVPEGRGRDPKPDHPERRMRLKSRSEHREAKLSAQPMSRDDLVAALLRIGCHQTDIGDAFDEADPAWFER